MSEASVWVSGILSNMDLVVGSEFDRENPAWKALLENREVDPSDLPLKMHATYQNQRFEDGLPDWFTGGGGTKVSRKIRDLLEEFNLGSGQMLPASFFLSDRSTLVTSEIFVLNNWQAISGLVPEQSQNIRASHGNPFSLGQSEVSGWLLPYSLNDNEIAVDAAKIGSIDSWYDAKFEDAVFFSDPLKRALCDAGFAKLFDFKKCILT